CVSFLGLVAYNVFPTADRAGLQGIASKVRKNIHRLSRLCRSGNKAWRLWSVGGWPIAIFRKEILKFLKALDPAIPFQLAYSCLSTMRAEYSQPRQWKVWFSQQVKLRHVFYFVQLIFV